MRVSIDGSFVELRQRMRSDRSMGQPQWFVYLVRCGSGTLYTGIATDVARRLSDHRQARGKGAKYLRGRGPLRLVFEKRIGGRGLALSVERRIKKLSKARKETLIEHGHVIDEIIALARSAPPCDRS